MAHDYEQKSITAATRPNNKIQAKIFEFDGIVNPTAENNEIPDIRGKNLLGQNHKRIWNLNDSINIRRLPILTRSCSHSVYHSFSYRCCLSHTSFSRLFRPCSPSLWSSLCFMASSHAADTNPPQSTPTETVRIVIKGRVQGVFYRNWTIENANQLGLKGWVRNKRDGSVEALFSGNPDSVLEMEQRCCRGPPDAMVMGLDVFPCNDDPGTGFERKPTV